ncbi:MAG: LPS export ABC transporter permease LptF [Geminicoccaceae bacterium]
MKIYLRYLVWQLLLPAIIATVAFSGAVWLSQSLRFVDLIVNKGLPLTTFLYFTALLFPSLLLVIIPFALFCAVIFAYHRLSTESELIVMKAVGLSNMQLALPGLLLSGLLVIFGFVNSLYLMPSAFRSFKDLEYQISRDFSHLLLQPGVFNTPVPNLTVYVREATEDGKLGGILVHDARTPTLPVTMMAENGVLLQGEKGPAFVLQNGNRQELNLTDQAERSLSILHFASYTLDMAAAARPPENRKYAPEELFIHELFDPLDETLSDEERQERVTEGHKRLTWPLNALVFAVIGMTALLIRRHDRQGLWRGMLSAVIAVVVVQALSTASSSLVLRTPALVPLLYIVPLAPVALCIAMLFGYRPLRLIKGLLSPQPGTDAVTP